MDLEARTREFFAAHQDLRPERIIPFAAPDVHVEYVDAFVLDGRTRLAQMLEAMHGNLAALGMNEVLFEVHNVALRRNITFAQWTCRIRREGKRELAYEGVHVLSWDRDGLVTHAMVYTDAENIRQLAVGSNIPAMDAI
jgi:hypothetical protein